MTKVSRPKLRVVAMSSPDPSLAAELALPLLLSFLANKSRNRSPEQQRLKPIS